MKRVSVWSTQSAEETQQGVIQDTGWRRLIGSPKLQIIFHKRATKYRLLLRKMTYKDKESYESSPPCITCVYLSHHTYQWVMSHIWMHCVSCWRARSAEEIWQFVTSPTPTHTHTHTHTNICICLTTHSKTHETKYTNVQEYILI